MRTQITVVGYLGGDPEQRDVGEHSVCNFSLATNRKVKGEDVTDWFNIAAWGKLGDLCHQYLAKGRQAVVAGSFEPRQYESNGETRTSLDIRANEVHFIGDHRSDGDSGRGAADDESTAATQRAATQERAARDEDPIPF